LDAQGSRYQAALARVLSQPRIGRPAPPKEKEEPEEKETSRLPMLQDLMRLARNPKTENEARQLLLVLVATSLQPGLPMTPGRIEAIKLANDIISQHDKDPKSVPFDVLAEAYSIKGLWTRALVVYVKGLRPYVRNDYYQGLLTLVSNHPQLKRPESLNPPNPIEAENHYAQGLTFYYAGNYADAERQFKLATEYFSEDARYFYFLGLTRLMLGKPEAAEDFEQGAKLEKQNKPTSADISTSLERVQGAPRRLLNEARKNLP
jgi:tetratricopeptide (TPR) repeat protein